MLKPRAFANALTLVIVLFDVVACALWYITPRAFAYFINAQFGGADIAQLYSETASIGFYIGSFVVSVVTAWVFGYLWALLYNQFTK